jgi:hypothetical protein
MAGATTNSRTARQGSQLRRGGRDADLVEMLSVRPPRTAAVQHCRLFVFFKLHRLRQRFAPMCCRKGPAASSSYCSSSCTSPASSTCRDQQRQRPGRALPHPRGQGPSSSATTSTRVDEVLRLHPHTAVGRGRRGGRGGEGKVDRDSELFRSPSISPQAGRDQVERLPYGEAAVDARVPPGGGAR